MFNKEKLEKEFRQYSKDHGFKYEDKVLDPEFLEKLLTEYSYKISPSEDFKQKHATFFSENESIEKELEEIRERATKDKNITQSERWDQNLQSLKDWTLKQYQELNYNIPDDFLVKQNPNGVFNASAVKLKYGKIVFYNVGIMSLLNKIIKILAWEAVAEMEGELERENINSLITIFILGYIANDNARSLPRLPGIPASLRYTFGQLLDNAEKFVMAHEFGHLINEDFEKEYPEPENGVDELLINIKKWQEEFNADHKAAECMLHWYLRQREMISLSRLDDKKKYLRVFSNVLAGPLFFLGIADMIIEVHALLLRKKTVMSISKSDELEKLERDLNDGKELDDLVIYSDYPPIILRHNAICEFFAPHLSDEEINWMMIYPNWIEDRKQDLLSKLTDKYGIK
jgi:hypothetical protein